MLYFNLMRHKKQQDIQLNSDQYSFKPLTEKDLPLLYEWINRPHIKKWWDSESDFESFKKRYSTNIKSKLTFPHLVYLNNLPLGYINYWLAESDKNFAPYYPKYAVGTDQFIGEENFLGKGHGSNFIRQFTDVLLKKDQIELVITDPNLENKAAIQCYKKAGFLSKQVIKINQEEILVMEKDNYKTELSVNSKDIKKIMPIVASFGGSPKELKEIKAYVEKELLELGDNRVLILLTKDHQTLGCVQLVLNHADDDPDLANGKNLAHVHALQIHKSFQRKGLGTKLIQALEREAKNRGITKLTLGVDGDNPKAIGLYNKLGYQRLKETEGRDPETPLYYMCKDI